MPNELLIPFESLAARGVQKDTKMKTGSSSSFFYNIYLQTYKLIDQICHENKKYSEKNKAKKCDNVGEQDLNCIQNIIAFTGRRGTGKTSAMLSIIDSLTIPCISKEFRTETESKSFICNSYTSFPYIDAAMMAENEDMFEIVLSRMAASVKRQFGTTYDRKYKYYEHQAQIDSVLEKICNVYEHYSSLMGVNSDSSKIVHNFMEIVSNKHNVRNEFIDLVREYTDLFSVVNEKKDCYLVICIDDIDMSLPNHMSIMQCIHQYFMIPKTIVMVSLNFDLLTATLQKDIFSKLQISSSTSSEHETQMHLTRSQTYDFLKKVIPPDMRITMPSWKKRDYVELSPSKIDFSFLFRDHKLDNSKIENMFPNLQNSMLIRRINLDKEDIKLTPKELIMILLADRTKCFLDICGYKMHFMQPYSLRSLNDLFYLFYNMENIFPLENALEKAESENREVLGNIYYSKREGNRKILLDYLNFKMLHEFGFDSEKLNFIDSLLASPIERRGRIIWEYYHKLLSSEENKKRIESAYSVEDYNRFSYHKVEDYTLGELFRCLFLSTRLGIFSSDFVKFILASFSFTMPQFIELERKTERHDSKKWIDEGYETYWYPRAREAFCYSLIGSWCNDLFGGSVGIVIDPSCFSKDSLFNDNHELSEDGNNRVKLLFTLLTLCSCSSSDYIKVYKDNDDDNKYIIKAKIDPTAFILNSLRLEKRIDKVRFKVFQSKEAESKNEDVQSQSLFEWLLGISYDEMREEELKSIKDTVVQLRNELTMDSAFPLFLLKHTDMTYNVIKRVVRYMLYSSDNVATVKDNILLHSDSPEMVISNFYKLLVLELERQDKEYYSQNESDEDKKKHFATIFSNNPIVALFYPKISEEIVMAENNTIEKGSQEKEKRFLSLKKV